MWGLIIWSIIRYRKRPGDDTLPEQTRYHIPLEITYTVIPIVIVAVIFGFVVHAENKIDHLSKNPAVTVKVEGFQWGWRFSYLRPDGSVIGTPVVGNQDDNPTLVLPEGETVRLELRLRRCHPLLLRARLPLQAGPHPGRQQPGRPLHRQDGHVPGPLRRVLRDLTTPT